MRYASYANEKEVSASITSCPTVVMRHFSAIGQITGRCAGDVTRGRQLSLMVG